MSLWLDSRPLHGRRQGGSGQRCSKGSWCTREVEAWERSRRDENRKNRKKKRRRQSRKTEAACVASAGCNNLLIVYTISTAPSKVAPGTMYEPLAWQQTAAWKETGWKRTEMLQGKLMYTRGGSLREKQKRRESEEEEEEETKTKP